MRSVSALLVAFLVVTAGAPIGVAAAASGGTSLSAATATGAAQVQDGGVQAQTTATTPANGTDTNDTAAPDGDSTSTADETASESNGSGVAPGAKLAGVVAVQGAEIDGEVASRAFGQRVAAAATNDSKAAVVAAELNTSQERLEALRTRLDELEQARASGNVSQGRYNARAAQLTAEINAVERQLEQSNETASALPKQVREENGINTSNIERLRTEARNLSGPEVAAAAREIAGENSGRGLGDAEDVPGLSGETPGQSGDAPGQSGDVPGLSDGDVPGQSGDAADERDDDAGDNETDGLPEDAANASDLVNTTNASENAQEATNLGNGDAGPPDDRPANVTDDATNDTQETDSRRDRLGQGDGRSVNDGFGNDTLGDKRGNGDDGTESGDGNSTADAPGNSENAPGQSGDGSDDRDGAPDNSGDAPGESGDAPGRSD
jgi:Skp family chaperone for outer membrane proteins